MLKNLLSLVFILSTNFCIAQTTFQKTFGGGGNNSASSVKRTSDGGYIVVGYADSLGAGSKDIFLVRLNFLGDTLWTKTYGGNSNEFTPFVDQTSDGGFIIAGTTLSFGAGGADMIFIKTTSNGTMQWAKTLGSSSDEQAFVIRQLSSGSYIAVGTTNSFGAGGSDGYAVMLNSNGTLAWAKAYGTTGHEFIYDIQQTSDGGFVMTGTTNPTFSGDDNEVCVIKTNSSGDVTWAKKAGSTRGVYGNSIIQTTDGGYAIGGFIDRDFPQYDNSLLLKLNSAGSNLFSKNYHLSNSDVCNSIRETADNGFVMAGRAVGTSSSNDFHLIKTDLAGTVSFSKTYGGIGDEECFSIQNANGPGYIMAGYTTTFGSAAQSFYLIKTDSVGSSGCNHTNATMITVPTTLTDSSLTITPTSAGSLTDVTPLVSSGSKYSVICIAIGIDEVENADSRLTIYPNPAQAYFTIQWNDEFIMHKVELEILDITGRQISSAEIKNQKSEIRNLNLSPGVYFVKVQDGKSKAVQKLVIE